MIGRFFSNPACRRGEHEFEDTPAEVSTGYQLARDGTRVEGHWARYACRHCNYVQERWEGPRVAAVSGAPAFVADEGAYEPRRGRNLSDLWEHPAATWTIVVIVIALAAYAIYWDAHVRRGPATSTEIIRPRER